VIDKIHASIRKLPVERRLDSDGILAEEEGV
jgi:hypothetical protein